MKVPGIDAPALTTLIPALIALWIIVSIPVYISAKVLTGGRARFVQALGATLLGPLIYAGVFFATSVTLGAIAGGLAMLPALLLSLIAWFWVYRASFKTGWLAAIGISILAVIVFFVAGLIISIVIALFFPGAPHVLPTPLQQA